MRESLGDARVVKTVEGIPPEAVERGSLSESRELRRLLRETYTAEGVELWLKQAEKDGLALQQALDRAAMLAHGNIT